MIHNLYLSLSSFKLTVLIFLSILAKATSTSTKTVHKLSESMMQLLATLTESIMPAQNISTIFYYLRSYPYHPSPDNGFFSELTYCISFFLGYFKASVNIFTPSSPSPVYFYNNYASLQYVTPPPATTPSFIADLVLLRASTM